MGRHLRSKFIMAGIGIAVVCACMLCLEIYYGDDWLKQILKEAPVGSSKKKEQHEVTPPLPQNHAPLTNEWGIPTTSRAPAANELGGALLKESEEALSVDMIRKWAATPGSPKMPSYKIDSDRGRIEYHSSPEELRWLDGARVGKLCATAAEPALVQAARITTNFSSHRFHHKARPYPPASSLQHKHLSRFISSSSSSSSSSPFIEYIEPLTGIARHPFSNVSCPNPPPPLGTKDLFNIEYLVLHNRCGSPEPKPRVLLFDMGASEGASFTASDATLGQCSIRVLTLVHSCTFIRLFVRLPHAGFKGVEGGVYETLPDRGSGTAPSLPIFYRLFTDRCLEPDDIFAWEPNKKMAATEWWGALPARLRAKTRFYETLVEEGSLSTALGDKEVSGSSLIHLLESVAKPEDFVILKLDIDTPGIEHTIADAIALRPNLPKLIDELFFEYQ